MKATYKFFTKSGASQKDEEFDTNRECFSYPPLFLLEENFYLMNGKQRSNGPDINGPLSTVAVKRLIHNVRDVNFLKIDDSIFVRNQTDELYKSLYFHPLIEMISLAPSGSFFHQRGAETKSSLKMSQSIHSIFLFLEDRFPKSNRVLKTYLPQNLHLETPIRLFRRQIKDVLFPHFIRIIYYRDKIFCWRNLSFCKERGRKNIDTLFRNFYNYGIDILLLIPWKKGCKARVNYYLPIDRHNIIRKLRYVPTYKFKLNLPSIDAYIIQSSRIHYGRYRNKFILCFRGTSYFVRKWFYHFSIIFKHHFHYRTRFNKSRLELLPVSCVSFLGYTSLAQSVSKNVRVETATGLCISISIEEKFYPKIPILILIKVLVKQKFCDSNGRPTGKSAWTALKDDEIFNRYAQLWRALSLYYGASTSRGHLRRLRYILQISCGSTLAGKHRGTTRLLRRRFNLDLDIGSFFLSNESQSSKNRRIWRLTLTRSILAKFVLSEIGF
uniref:maturase K n=1 Tax=Pteris arisanensis TaxID=1508565 RepID=UPI002A8195AE|nr:maturase K [Pteris arisanensis]WNR48996.1 maturase K [Pteris arisanensis]